MRLGKKQKDPQMLRTKLTVLRKDRKKKECNAKERKTRRKRKRKRKREREREEKTFASSPSLAMCSFHPCSHSGAKLLVAFSSPNFQLPCHSPRPTLPRPVRVPTRFLGPSDPRSGPRGISGPREPRPRGAAGPGGSAPAGGRPGR